METDPQSSWSFNRLSYFLGVAQFSIFTLLLRMPTGRKPSSGTMGLHLQNFGRSSFWNQQNRSYRLIPSAIGMIQRRQCGIMLP
jgi:hypothetical protein